MAQDAWLKSSFSGGGDSDDCVELTARQGAVLLRESDEPGTVIETTGTGLAALIRHLGMSKPSLGQPDVGTPPPRGRS